MTPQFEMPRAGVGRIMNAPPRLNLRRAASYQGEKAPLSSSSAVFSFNHLISSPPPSPGLPPPRQVTRPRKLSNAPRPSRVFRFVFWITALIGLLYVASLLARRLIGNAPAVVSWVLEGGGEEYEMVGQDELPDFPTPISVVDIHGRPKWTVSIPPNREFPLSVQEYSDMCAMCREVAAHTRELHGGASAAQQTYTNYYYEDPHFVDVREAETKGLLPDWRKIGKILARATEKQLVGAPTKDRFAEKLICKSSMTFVLESSDAGLGTSLMMLWMAYGLAKKEDRAFFIDDTRWAYGKYTDMFQPPPTADCHPPQRHEMLPCPRNARHLVVSAGTARDTFGQAFTTEFEDLRQDSMERERPIFNLARVGYEALFQLNSDDEPYVAERVEQLQIKASRSRKADDGNSTIVGVHVRHGDVRPYEYQYNGAYIPLTTYAERVHAALVSHHNRTDHWSGVVHPASITVMASDDPRVFDSDEFSETDRAQERIKLAAKDPVKHIEQDRSVMHTFTEEAIGWEGGFFSVMFWNLGRSGVGKQSQSQVNLAPETTRLRAYIGRAYIMDLAVLGRASDLTVCTISAMGCRLLAVMMGWEKAMVREQWVNIDGDYSWVAL